MKKWLKYSCYGQPVSNNDMAGIGGHDQRQQIRELVGPRAPPLFKSHQLPATRRTSPSSIRGAGVARTPGALLSALLSLANSPWMFLGNCCSPDTWCSRWASQPSPTLLPVSRRERPLSRCSHSSLKPAETANITSIYVWSTRVPATAAQHCGNRSNFNCERWTKHDVSGGGDKRKYSTSYPKHQINLK